MEYSFFVGLNLYAFSVNHILINIVNSFTDLYQRCIGYTDANIYKICSRYITFKKKGNTHTSTLLLNCNQITFDLMEHANKNMN